MALSAANPRSCASCCSATINFASGVSNSVFKSSMVAPEASIWCSQYTIFFDRTYIQACIRQCIAFWNDCKTLRAMASADSRNASGSSTFKDRPSNKCAAWGRCSDSIEPWECIPDTSRSTSLKYDWEVELSRDSEGQVKENRSRFFVECVVWYDVNEWSEVLLSNAELTTTSLSLQLLLIFIVLLLCIKFINNFACFRVSLTSLGDSSAKLHVDANR